MKIESGYFSSTAKFKIVLRRIVKTALKRLGLRHETSKETSLSKREGYETVFDDDTMMVLVIWGRRDESIVCFTGVGHQLGGIDVQNPEFARSQGIETKIFVIDKHRSWGNNLDWKKLKRIVDSLVPNAQITTLGNSMGGFLAILSAPILGATKAIAFVPQWSIDPTVVPEEDRWLEYTQKIAKIHYPDLSEAVKSESKIYAFFGNNKKDNVHRVKFEEEKIKPFVLCKCSHDAASYLKKAGLLYSVISACREEGDVRALITEANNLNIIR